MKTLIAQVVVFVYKKVKRKSVREGTGAAQEITLLLSRGPIRIASVHYLHSYNICCSAQNLFIQMCLA